MYSNPDMTEKIMQLISRDINGETSAKRDREGLNSCKKPLQSRSVPASCASH